MVLLPMVLLPMVLLPMVLFTVVLLTFAGYEQDRWSMTISTTGYLASYKQVSHVSRQ